MVRGRPRRSLGSRRGRHGPVDRRRLEEAEAAYGWLRNEQRDDGSWFAAYRDGAVDDGTRAETNFVAYVATGVGITT